MKRSDMKVLAISLACLLLGPIGITGLKQESLAASAQEINAWTQTALSDFRAKVPQGSKVLQDAKGILVFPHLYNAGFVVGGKFADGELIINNRVSGYYNLVGLSWGFQIGGQRQSLIIAFMTNDALQRFRSSAGWDLGGDATVAVVDVGTQGTVDTRSLNKPVLAFAVDQKGLMAGVSLKGTKITRITK